MEHEPDPMDTNAAAALLDPDYARDLAKYDAAYEALTHSLWENHYVHRGTPGDGLIDPLPDVSDILETETYVAIEPEILVGELERV
jgi:hypothetical protein